MEVRGRSRCGRKTLVPRTCQGLESMLQSLEERAGRELVWNRDSGWFKGVVLSSLEVLGTGTKRKGAWISSYLKGEAGKESRREEELTKKESTSGMVQVLSVESSVLRCQ